MKGKTIFLGLVVLVLALSTEVWSAKPDKTEKNTERVYIPGGVVFAEKAGLVYYDFQTEGKTPLTPIVGPKGPKIEKAVFAVSENGKVLVWWTGQKFTAVRLPKGAKGTSRYLGVAHDKQIESRTYGVKNLCVSFSGKWFAYNAVKVTKDTCQNNARALANILFFAPTDNSPNSEGKYNTEFLAFELGAFPLRKDYPGVPCFPAWSKNNTDVAYIRQKPDGFGPIVIAEHRKSVDQLSLDGRCIEKIFLPTCEGLAWRFNDTITCLSQGVLYSETGEIITRGINGTRPCWVSDSAFIFRGNDGALHLWEQGGINGNVKRVLASISESFSYCRVSPFEAGKIEPFELDALPESISDRKD